MSHPKISIFDSMGPRVSNTIPSTSTCISEVAKFIKELQTNKAYEGPSPKVIKWLEEELMPILTTLFNKFLDIGKYPSHCKIARVTALFKKGDKQVGDNYRPISILSQINKVFEKIIHSRLNSFLLENKLLSPLQYGFRKGHNTSHGITNLNEEIIRNLEKKRVCAALFIDLKSAFDTIDPTILVKKLDHIGVRGKMLQLLKSYLQDRKQYVKNGDVESIILDVLIGVPQGSVLGPLLFIIYVNDIVKCSKLSAVLFADDAVFTAQGENVKLLQRFINHEINLVHEWLVANKLTLNLSKTKYMIFHNKQDERTKKQVKKFRINVNKYCIKQVSEFKYLGIHFDNKLNWHSHIEYLCTKLSQAAGVIYKLKKLAPRAVLKTVYYSIVDSHLRYGILTWGSAKSTALLRLNCIHKKIIKYMKFEIETLPEAYENLNILSIESLHKLELSKFVHKIKSGTVPDTFIGAVTNIVHSHATRYMTRGNLALPQPRTDRGKTTIEYKGAQVWNSLPLPVKQITNTKTFVYELKKILMQNYINEISEIGS